MLKDDISQYFHDVPHPSSKENSPSRSTRGPRAPVYVPPGPSSSHELFPRVLLLACTSTISDAGFQATDFLLSVALSKLRIFPR